jgi:hypothetical protein
MIVLLHLLEPFHAHVTAKKQMDCPQWYHILRDSPSVDYVPGDSIRALADALEASPNFTLSKFRQVAYALRRLQSIPEQRVHAVRYEQRGCMVCTRSDTPHGGLGMCTRCYSREFQIRTRILRKLIEESDAGHCATPTAE